MSFIDDSMKWREIFYYWVFIHQRKGMFYFLFFLFSLCWNNASSILVVIIVKWCCYVICRAYSRLPILLLASDFQNSYVHLHMVSSRWRNWFGVGTRLKYFRACTMWLLRGRDLVILKKYMSHKHPCANKNHVWWL